LPLPLVPALIVSHVALLVAVQLQPDKKYDAKADTFTSTAGVVYHDNGAGSFATDQGKALEPGWKTYNGFKQFSKIVTDPLYRRPFLRVLLWTVVFAMSTVIFAAGLTVIAAAILGGLDSPLGAVVGGSLLVERVFAYPGVGYLLYTAVTNQDYPLMQALFLIITISVLLANFIVDIMYGILDPRTRR